MKIDENRWKSKESIEFYSKMIKYNLINSIRRKESKIIDKNRTQSTKIEYYYTSGHTSLPSLCSVVNGSTSRVVPLALVELCLLHVARCTWCNVVLRPGSFHELMSEIHIRWSAGVLGFSGISILGELLWRSRITELITEDFNVYFPELLWTCACGLRYSGWTMNCMRSNLETLNLVT